MTISNFAQAHYASRPPPSAEWRRFTNIKERLLRLETVPFKYWHHNCETEVLFKTGVRHVNTEVYGDPWIELSVQALINVSTDINSYMNILTMAQRH